MKAPIAYLLLPLLAATALPLRAQNMRGDLERIAQHRAQSEERARQGASAPLLQSWTDTTGIKSDWSEQDMVGTWQFAEETKAEACGLAADDGSPEPCVPARYETVSVDPALFDDLDFTTRLSVLPQELLIPYTEQLKHQILNYVERHKKSLRYILAKYVYYEPALREIFRSRGVPEDLTALAIVESAMSQTAVSHAGAKGMWQFMDFTAKAYGLRCDGLVDERYDIYKSADAAARLLGNAYRYYGDWALAISSYNCGRGNVDKAISRAGGERGFWDIYPYLPNETKGYMPAFVAALYSLYYYSFHGIELSKYGEQACVSVKIDKWTSFNEITRETGIDPATLKKLNPQFVRSMIPGDERTYYIKLPMKYAKAYNGRTK